MTRRRRLLRTALAVAVLVALIGCTPATGSRRVKVLLLGDSTGVFLTYALARWNDQARAIDLKGGSLMGCGFIHTGTEFASGVERGFAPVCTAWPWLWLVRIAKERPDVIVVAGGYHDITDRRLDPAGAWEHVGQSRFDTLLAFHFEYAARLLAGSGAKVLWVDTPPFADRQVAPGGVDSHPMNDPARAARYNSLLGEVLTRHRNQRVVGFVPFLSTQPGGVLSSAIRPDGMHVDGAGFDVVGPWLGGRILDAAR